METVDEHERTAVGQEQPAQDAEPKPSVARSTAMMSAATLVSRATGFIRTWAMAFALGNTYLAASYSLANNLPNMIYELVAGGVLSTAFLPIYLQVRNERSREHANSYASNLLSLTVVVLGVIALAASVFAPQVMVTQSLFSSASSQTVEAAIWLFRFFAFQVVFYGISAVFGGLLNAERRFFWPAVSSIFMNLVSIVTFFGYPFVSGLGFEAGLTWLAVGTTLAIAVLAFVQLPALVKCGFKFRFRIDLNGVGLRETVRLALPAIACTAINLVSLSFMNSCALHVAENGPASVSYAWMWYQFPYGVLGVALSTALFTEMSDALSRGDAQGFKKHLGMGLRTTWMLIIPMAAMLFACARLLIGLYAAGKFTADDIAPVAGLLRGWAVVLPLYASYMFLYRAFSSLKDLRTVAVCNLCFTVVQVTLYTVFTGVVEVPGLSGLGLVGISAGDFCFYTLMNATLLSVLRRRVGAFGFHQLVPSVLKVSVASLAGAALAMVATMPFEATLGVTTLFGAFVALVVTGVLGLAVIWVGCRLLRVEEVAALAHKLLARIKHR